MWKPLKYLFIAMLVALLGVAVYGWLDTAVSLDHAREQQKFDEESLELLRRFVVAFNHGTNRPDIAQYVKRNYAGPEHVIKEEPDRILVDGIVFCFDNTQSLSKVLFLDKGD